METYDWAWVQTHVEQTLRIWDESAGVLAPDARQYGPEEQQANEDAYDEALREVEDILRSLPSNGDAPPAAKDRIVAAFARFSARALGLNEEATDLLTHGFLPVGTSLAGWARRFDPAL